METDLERIVIRCVLYALAIALVVSACLYGAAYVREMDDGVVRASGPAIVHEQPSSPDCCLIPANRGLRGGGRPW